MTVWRMFETQVQRQPDALALRHGDHDVTYAALRAWSEAIAREVHDAAAAPGLVALALGYGSEVPAAVLACRRLGRPYVALDGALPLELRRALLEEVRPACVVRGRGVDLPSALSIPIVELPPCALSTGGGKLPPPPPPTADDLFHVVYTSGSTGRPKGVAIPERAVVNRLEWMWEAYPFAADAVLGIHKAPSLVASTWELLGGLLQGHPSVMISRPVLLDRASLRLAIARNRISNLFLVPMLLRILVDAAEREPEGWSSLRLVTNGADRLDAALALRFRAAFPGVTLLNLYGLTECSSNVAAFDVARLTPGALRVPVGKPIAGAEVRLLDPDGGPVQEGALGEVVVAGPPLADGYHNDPELTAARFVTDADGRRSFRTGDVARWLPSGDLDLVGRLDTQVKVRGHRVELQEVESVLAEAPGVAAAAVLCLPVDGAALLGLLEGDADVEAVRSFARLRLPDHAVPRRLRIVSGLPRGANGKLDRTALARFVDREVLSELRETSPDHDLESRLVEHWARLLDRPPYDRDHDFFEAGGDSLLAIELLSCLREDLGIDISLRAFFEQPSVAGVLAALESVPAGSGAHGAERGGQGAS